MTIKSVKLLLLLIGSAIFFSASIHQQLTDAHVDRAKKLHYRAIKLVKDQKFKKAKKLLIKAISLDRNPEYFIDLADLYVRDGKPKKAFETIEKIVIDDHTEPIKKVQFSAWKAYYGLSLGIPRVPREKFNDAIELMELYKIDSNSMLSSLYNNSAVSRIFYQSDGSTDDYPLIHRRDFEQASRYFQKAIELDPDNCTAYYNLEFSKTVLNEIPFDTMKYDYIEVEQFLELSYPDLFCILPGRPKHTTIVEKLSKYKEVVLVLDISGSMSAIASTGQSRFNLMQEVAGGIISDLDTAVQIGIITLGQDCAVKPQYEFRVGEVDRKTLSSTVDNLRLNGATPLNRRLQEARQLFTDKKGEKAIFLFSDGINSCNQSSSTCMLGQEIGASGINIFAFSLLLEESQYFDEYAIYDCITKASYGELIGITADTTYEVKTNYLSQDVYPLALKRQDLEAGRYTPLVPVNDTLTHSNTIARLEKNIQHLEGQLTVSK